MFVSRVVPRLSLLCRASGALQVPGQLSSRSVAVLLPSLNPNRELRSYSTAADSAPPPRWVQLEPELEEALVPRKLSVSPLESWLSLRYSLPAPPEAPRALEEDREPTTGGGEEAAVLPPSEGDEVPLRGGGEEEPATPLSCKNVLEIRRRKMNRHKYKKLLKRTKFLRRRVADGRRRRKQKRFEKDLQRIWMRAGLKKAPEGWVTPKIFIKQYGNKKD